MARRKPSPTTASDDTDVTSTTTSSAARGATARSRVSSARGSSSTALADAPTETAATSPGATPETAPDTEPTPGALAPGEKAISRSRAGSLWVAAIAVAIVLILLVVFIAQNSQKVTIHFVGLHGHFSLAIALLVALVGGVLLVAIPGSVRILQLRHTVKKRTVRR